MRRMFTLGLVALACACGGSDSPTSPSSPPPSATPTRIMALEGNLGFGEIELGQSSERTLTIRNKGNAPLTVNGMTAPSGSGGAFTSTFTSGTIAAGAAQAATIRFAPTEPRAYNGTITVNGNQTGGTNTIAVAAGAINTAPPWSRSGTGDSVFDMPSTVGRVRIQASTPSRCQNFAVDIKGRLVVNVILGTCSVADTLSHDGTYLTPGGGVVEITISSGVNWTFTEVR